MRLEHLAFNLAAAPAVVAWYAKHLRMPIVRETRQPYYCAFLGEGGCLLEIYDNPRHPYLDPTRLDPLTLHVALKSQDLASDSARLRAAGAVHLDGAPGTDGCGLIMLRCPWGLPLQLCTRQNPLIEDRPCI